MTTALAYDLDLSDMLRREHRREAFELAQADRRALVLVPEPSIDDDIADLDAMLAPFVAEPAPTPAEAAPASRADKSVKPGRPVSILREAATAQELQAFALGRCEGLQPAGPVYLRGKALSLSHPLTSTTTANDNQNHHDAILQALLDGVPEASQVTTTTKPSRRPWWTSFSTTERSKPQAWRFLSDHTKADAAFFAAHKRAEDTGRVVWAYSVNFGDEVITKAFAADRAADYAARKIDRNLKDRGIEPDTFLVIEDRVGPECFDDRRLHGHGWLVAGADQRELVIEALKAAGGSYASEEHQVRLDEARDAGWATYCLKGLHWTRTVAWMHPSCAPSFKGSPIKISASLRRHTEVFYNEFRSRLAEDCKSNVNNRACRTFSSCAARRATSGRTTARSSPPRPSASGSSPSARGLPSSSPAVLGRTATARASTPACGTSFSTARSSTRSPRPRP